MKPPLKIVGAFSVFPMPHLENRKKKTIRTSAQVIGDRMARDMEAITYVTGKLYMSCPPKYSRMWEREVWAVMQHLKKLYKRVSEGGHAFNVVKDPHHPYIVYIERLS